MLTDEEFRLFKNLIYEESGIYLKENRKDFLENRLVKRMAETKMASPYWYYKLITEKMRSELLILLDILTVNETSFFRNRPQMDLFKNLVLPEIIRKNGKEIQKRLRIWSAGCSTGEEPYSIAMMVSDAVDLARGWDIKIFASDLSLTALQAAAKGEYAEDKVQATVDDQHISRYFSKNGSQYKIRDALKKLVIFDYHNMKNENGISGLDVIFCRNVMIYFDTEEQKRLSCKFFDSLNPGGYLLIGHAESFQGMNTGFQFVYDNKGTAYKKPMEGGKC